MLNKNSFETRAKFNIIMTIKMYDSLSFTWIFLFDHVKFLYEME